MYGSISLQVQQQATWWQPKLKQVQDWLYRSNSCQVKPGVILRFLHDLTYLDNFVVISHYFLCQRLLCVPNTFTMNLIYATCSTCTNPHVLAKRKKKEKKREITLHQHNNVILWQWKSCLDMLSLTNRWLIFFIRMSIFLFFACSFNTIYIPAHTHSPPPHTHIYTD